MTLVAISAAYGAGGSVVGHGVSEQLGAPFLDRAIPVGVAEQLGVSEDEAALHDEAVPGTRLERMLAGFIGTDSGAPTPIPGDFTTSEAFRRATEAMLREQAASGHGVILGRAAAVVLRSDPRVLRVRLTGPVEQRVTLAMHLGGVDRATATAALHRLDRVHADYAEHFYGVDIDDPALYHLVIDSTTVALDVCVNVITECARAGLPSARAR